MPSQSWTIPSRKRAVNFFSCMIPLTSNCESIDCRGLYRNALGRCVEVSPHRSSLHASKKNHFNTSRRNLVACGATWEVGNRNAAMVMKRVRQVVMEIVRIFVQENFKGRKLRRKNKITNQKKIESFGPQLTLGIWKLQRFNHLPIAFPWIGDLPEKGSTKSGGMLGRLRYHVFMNFLETEEEFSAICKFKNK